MLAQVLSESETNPEKKTSLALIAEAGKELLTLCDGILDFARIELGELPLIEQKFSCRELVDKIKKIEMPALKSKVLGFHIDYDQKIPNYLIGDAHRLLRILINLVSNAVKFTEKGTVTLKVMLGKLDRECDRAVIHFCVEDTGIGIPQNQQDFLYEKFGRLTFSNTGKYKGLGLGLCLVKKFITELAGEIAVESEVGKGTAFVCTIPFKLPLVA